jgi:hypothetical protein
MRRRLSFIGVIVSATADVSISGFANDAQLAATLVCRRWRRNPRGAVRHRLNRGGNRRLNSILHRIVLMQAHASPGARAYLTRRVSEGKSRREATRALKRYVARSVWRLWQQCGPVSTRATAEIVAA